MIDVFACGSTEPVARFRAALPGQWPDPSVRFGRPTGVCIRRICIAMVSVACSALSQPAQAADHGQLGPASPEIKAWANSLENKWKEGCCSTADGWKPQEVEYDMKGNKYRVKIEGQWYDVPPEAVITSPNRFGFPVVWYYQTWLNGIRPSISIRCFIPGAGG